ncbi:Zinc finger BED domain-containing protein RICESLEEPER 2 [Linum perenne]
MDGKYLQLCCVAHIVNLVVHDGFNEIGMFVRRVREALRWVRSLGAREEKFRAQVKALNVESNKMVSLDCPTKWNSTYLMLDIALTFEHVFTVLEEMDPTFKEDWKMVRNLNKFMKFFHRMTKVASRTKYCIVHLFIGDLIGLYIHIRKASIGHDQHLVSVGWNMRSKVQKYWIESEIENVRMNNIHYKKRTI